MLNNTLSLNGSWLLDYLSPQPYTGKEEPQLHNDAAVSCPVPGYWEDMEEIFRSTALYSKLSWNPLYTRQRYPQAGYVPDMALPNPVGCFVYQKKFVLTDIPSVPSMLSVGGVQNTLSAWINGHYLGRHEGYSAPFALEIPVNVLIKGENRITLAVSNNRLAGYMGRPVSGLTSRAANECTGGIWGDIDLHFLPDGLRDAWITTAEDCSSFTVHVDGGEAVEKTVQIFDENTLLCTAKIPVGQNACTLSAAGYTLWSPDCPKRYTAEIATAHQTISRTFGIRRLTVRGTKLYLNNEPYFFRGSCEHCYQPMTVHPTRDKRYYRMVIRKLKDLGFNSLRFHTWVPPKEYMEAADELGMVMEIESPNNTTLTEWQEIVRFCRSHAAVNVYSTGNELQIDADYERHLESCAALIHNETDSLFSPMSAMRGIEYNFLDGEYVEKPFRYNPRRLADVGKFCDLYNSYSNALTSYSSARGTQPVLDKRNTVYGKPLLSHEIGIHGTYIDLSLEERYRGSRIGETEFMSSVRQHLADKGLLEKAPLYYRNSSAWQQILRKHCFETLRRCESFAGYDFLGDIDTHWHTFGYCVGMMNEFYELKPGETVENVRKYNSDTVLLADFPSGVNFTAGETVEIPLLVSHYGKPIPKALLQIHLSGAGKVLYRKELHLGEIPRGAVTGLYRASFRLPKWDKPMALTLSVELSGGDCLTENQWDLYVFPKNTPPSAKELRDHDVIVRENCSAETLLADLSAGKRVVLFGKGPFASSEVSWQIALAGRTNGHLATVIADHPLMEDFPHSGYCGRQFEHMLNGSYSAHLDLPDIPHEPVIDIASSYKNAIREGMLFSYRVGMGKLLVCTLNMQERDPAARWLKNRILSYAAGREFSPEIALTNEQLAVLCKVQKVKKEENSNQAMNKNDITM